MAKFEIVPNLTFCDRAKWGADSNHPRQGHKVARTRRTHVIIHHTVIGDNDDSPNLWSTESKIFANMRKLQTVRPDLGLDVPYNFVAYFIKKNSGVYICEGRGEDRSGAHTKGHNSEGIAISIAGDFSKDSLAGIECSKRMYLLSAFMGWLKFNASHPDYGDFKPMKKLGSLKPEGRNVYFHKDFKNTKCPGKLLTPLLSQLDFVNPSFL